mgnify:CR=1 FL=1
MKFEQREIFFFLTKYQSINHLNNETKQQIKTHEYIQNDFNKICLLGIFKHIHTHRQTENNNKNSLNFNSESMIFF